ncbi:MAG: K(+)-transporting ATPase subunit F [Ignavibacteriaceae bacterium]|nr:K(+)-transporting ATPase subunit F [Ignavibacteriaceae bacterium]
MNPMFEILFLIIASALLIYLVYTLIKPEKF